MGREITEIGLLREMECKVTELLTMHAMGASLEDVLLGLKTAKDSVTKWRDEQIAEHEKSVTASSR